MLRDFMGKTRKALGQFFSVMLPNLLKLTNKKNQL